jgi:hypothetical protein
MREVYRGTDTKLKRQVAITIPPPALTTTPERFARFQREAEAISCQREARECRRRNAPDRHRQLDFDVAEIA